MGGAIVGNGNGFLGLSERERERERECLLLWVFGGGLGKLSPPPHTANCRQRYFSLLSPPLLDMASALAGGRVAKEEPSEGGGGRN